MKDEEIVKELMKDKRLIEEAESILTKLEDRGKEAEEIIKIALVLAKLGARELINELPRL